MKSPRYLRRQQRSGVFVALLLFELVLILLQLWLFVSALDGTQAGEIRMAVSGALVSLVCLAVNSWMLIGLSKVNREA